jgi:hypothetical protein
MDTNELISHSRARFDHHQARTVLKEKYQAKLTFAHRGGMFKAGPELLALLHSCPVEDQIVIEDLYGNPIKVDPLELQHLAHSRWQEQMNAWLVEYEELNRNR